ncbi:MAG: hypothetical protein ABIT37_19525 [Luteolibacter sp.]
MLWNLCRERLRDADVIFKALADNGLIRFAAVSAAASDDRAFGGISRPNVVMTPEISNCSKILKINLVNFAVFFRFPERFPNKKVTKPLKEAAVQHLTRSKRPTRPI